MNVFLSSFVGGIVARTFVTRTGNLGGNVPEWGHKALRVHAHLHHLAVIYLLLHIGLVGGAEIARSGMGNLVVPGGLSVGLALVMFGISLWFLRALGMSDDRERIALATHFGSVSVGTFAAAQAALVSRGIPFDAGAAAWLALMEIPAILAGSAVLGRGVTAALQALRDRDILILFSSFLGGYFAGPGVVSGLAPIISTPFDAILAYFLFNMGYRAGAYIFQMRHMGSRLVLFGVAMPLVGAPLATLIGALLGLNLGDLVLLSTLTASASYVAAPAAMSKLVPPKAVATSLAVSLGVTLPWNMSVGIPLYMYLASLLMETHWWLAPLTDGSGMLPRGTWMVVVALLAFLVGVGGFARVWGGSRSRIRDVRKTVL